MTAETPIGEQQGPAEPDSGGGAQGGPQGAPRRYKSGAQKRREAKEREEAAKSKARAAHAELVDQAEAYLREMGLQGRYDAVVCVEAIEQLREDLRVQRETPADQRSSQEWRQIMDGTGKLIDNTRRLMAMAMDQGDRFESEDEARAFIAKMLEKWPNLLVFEVKHG